MIGYSPWGHKESDMTEQLHFFSLGAFIKHLLCARFWAGPHHTWYPFYEGRHGGSERLSHLPKVTQQ